MLGPTMLQYVALACCNRLAGALLLSTCKRAPSALLAGFTLFEGDGTAANIWLTLEVIFQ